MSEIGNPTHDAIHHAASDLLDIIKKHPSDSVANLCDSSPWFLYCAANHLAKN